MPTAARTQAAASAAAFSAGIPAKRGATSAASTPQLPTTSPTEVSVTGISGTIHIRATSTAPSVEFLVDGSPISSTVPTEGGVAGYDWPSWGYANGTRTVAAVDCDDTGCATTATSTTLELNNGTPTVTSPTAQQTVGGTLIMGASSAGGGIQFRVDGHRVGFDGSSPYSLTYSGSALSEGSHEATVVSCSSDEKHCLGPQSAAVPFSVKALHPRIASISANPFSPNGDKVKDTTTVTISLPDTEAVTLTVLSRATGAISRGPIAFGVLRSGNHTWTWDGRTNSKSVASNGSYTIRVATTAEFGGATLSGLASAILGLDTVAPTLWSTAGIGATFYPYHDDYKDTFSPSTMVSERGWLSLDVTTTAGTTVRVISGAKNPGRAWLTWTGWSSAGQYVAEGYYRWRFHMSDPAGNQRSTPWYTVYDSHKKLVKKSATVAHYGKDAFGTGADPSYCGESSTEISDYAPYGLWLATNCDPYFDGSAATVADYKFSVPNAIRYDTMSLQVWGYTMYPESQLSCGFERIDGSGNFDVRLMDVAGGAAAWHTLCWMPGALYVRAGAVTVGWGVDNYYGVSDFDAKYVRLNVTYEVLQ
jgi:flagellar hook assembly protein FlgD